MNKTLVSSLLLALAGVCTTSLHAELAWTKVEGAPSDWSALPNNLLLNKPGTTTGTVSYLTPVASHIGKITDGVVPTSRSYNEMLGFAKDATVEWNFGAPHTLEKIRITTCAISDGLQYDDITIADVMVKRVDSEDWVSLGCESVEWKGSDGAGIMLYVLLEDSETGCVAESVTGLRVKFGPHTTVAQYYSEIEAVGFAEATGPVLSAFGITPARTKAAISGSLADVGTDATACDVYLSLDGGTATKIIEGATSGRFEYELKNLTAGTTYAYELSISNNAPTAKGTVRSGSFTTLDASAQTASWTQGEYVPGDWTALDHNILRGLTATESYRPSPYASQDMAKLTDGSVPDPAAGGETVGFQPNGTVAWAFDEPMAIRNIRISSLWETTAYNGISVDAIHVKYKGATEWEALDVPTVQWTGGTALGQTETLSDAESGYLARSVVGLKITFGAQKAAVANYYAEIEAVGRVEPKKGLVLIIK